MKRLKLVSSLGITAAALLTTVAFAESQNFYSEAHNEGRNDSFSISVPATCNISSTVGLYNPIQPFGGGGGSATVTLVNIATVYSFGYGSNISGTASRSATGQSAGYYTIAHYVTAGGSGAVGYASTTFTW